MNSDDIPPPIQFLNTSITRPTKVNRPGISSETLDAAGVRHINEEEARSLIGYAVAGLLIPYQSRKGVRLVVNGKPFCRVRLDKPRLSCSWPGGQN